MFGLERLRELFASCPDSPAAVRDRIVAALSAHQGGPIGEDDQTLVVLGISD